MATKEESHQALRSQLQKDMQGRQVLFFLWGSRFCIEYPHRQALGFFDHMDGEMCWCTVGRKVLHLFACSDGEAPGRMR